MTCKLGAYMKSRRSLEVTRYELECSAPIQFQCPLALAVEYQNSGPLVVRDSECKPLCLLFSRMTDALHRGDRRAPMIQAITYIGQDRPV